MTAPRSTGFDAWLSTKRGSSTSNPGEAGLSPQSEQDISPFKERKLSKPTSSRRAGR